MSSLESSYKVANSTEDKETEREKERERNLIHPSPNEKTGLQ